MTSKKLYRYIGYNGIITSPVLLDGATHQVVYELRPSQGKKLTDGEKVVYAVVVPEEELENWKEIEG